jgi:hypothetical protein
VEDGTKTRKVGTPNMDENEEEMEIVSQMDEDGTEVATEKVDTMSMEVMDIEKIKHIPAYRKSRTIRQEKSFLEQGQ